MPARPDRCPTSLALLLCAGSLLCWGCEGTLGPSDAPSSHELYYLYGLDEGPNATQRTPSALDPRWSAEADPYRLGVAEVESFSLSSPEALLVAFRAPSRRPGEAP